MSELLRDSALDDLVRQIPSPTVAFELESLRILSANTPAERTLGWTVQELKHMAMTDLLRPDEVTAGVSSMGLVASGYVQSYQAIRHLKNRSGPKSEATFRIRRLTVSGYAIGLASIETNLETGVDSADLTSITIALAVTDHEWVIEHMSSDIEFILDQPPDAFIGTPLLSWVEPSDVARFVSSIGRIVAEGGGGTIQTSMRCGGGTFAPTWSLVVPLDTHSPPRIGLVLTGCPTVGEELTLEIDRQLSRGGGVVKGLGDVSSRLPSVGLSTRQLEILTELLQGRGVKEISKKLFLSQSTVRNHLTDIFKKYDVHSQPELLAKFIRPLDAGSESDSV